MILVPGPQTEINIVRRIFRSFVNEKKSRTQIAAELNAEKIRNSRGSHWTMLTIHNTLKNERYIGHSIYGRKSIKLGQKSVVNPPEMWIRHANVFKAIVSPKLFAKAQSIIAERRHRRSDQEMLDLLTALWRKKGHLSVNIITSAKNVPPVSNYTSRFGSLYNAYKRIGYQLDPRYDYMGSRSKVEIVINSVVDDVVSNIERLGGSVTYVAELHLLTVNAKVTVTIGVATCVSDGTIRARRWQLRRFKYEKADFSLVLKMDESNTNIQAYYLMPTNHLILEKNHRLRVTSRVFAEQYRHDNLGAFYRMWTRKEALPRI